MERMTIKETTIPIELTLTELLDIETAILDKIGKLQEKGKWDLAERYLKISACIREIAASEV